MLKRAKFFSLFILLFLSGCTLWDYIKPPEREVTPARGNKEEARELLHSFMQARIAGESDDYIRAFLTQEAWNDYQGKDFILKTTNSQELVGYNIINESEAAEGRFAFTVVVQEIDLEPVEGRNLQEEVTIRFSEEEYLISSARLITKNVAQARAEEIMWRGPDEKGQEKEEVIFNLRDLPTELVPVGGKPEEKLGVGREGFSSMVIFPSNKGLAFGTRGSHGMIATLTWDERPFGQGEKVTLNPIDLFPTGTVGLAAVSPNSQYLAVELKAAAGSSGVRVYQTAERNLLNLGLEEAFPQDKYDVRYNRWSPESDRLILRVNGLQGAAGIDQNKLGTWEVNIKTGEREKIVS